MSVALMDSVRSSLDPGEPFMVRLMFAQSLLSKLGDKVGSCQTVSFFLIYTSIHLCSYDFHNPLAAAAQMIRC